MPKITSRTPSITVQQRMVLGQNPHLWGAAILEDGDILCLDRDAQGTSVLDLAKDWAPIPHVLMRNGRLLSVYHYYMRYHGFTYLKPKQRKELKYAPSPLVSRDYLTIAETVDYISTEYGIKRVYASITGWVQKGLVESKTGTVNGHYVRLIDRQALDDSIQCGLLPPPLGRGPSR